LRWFDNISNLFEDFHHLILSSSNLLYHFALLLNLQHWFVFMVLFTSMN